MSDCNSDRAYFQFEKMNVNFSDAIRELSNLNLIYRFLIYAQTSLQLVNKEGIILNYEA